MDAEFLPAVSIAWMTGLVYVAVAAVADAAAWATAAPGAQLARAFLIGFLPVLAVGLAAAGHFQWRLRSATFAGLPTDAILEKHTRQLIRRSLLTFGRVPVGPLVILFYLLAGKRTPSCSRPSLWALRLSTCCSPRNCAIGSTDTESNSPERSKVPWAQRPSSGLPYATIPGPSR